MLEVTRLQKHLLLIRRTVGWTAEELGERIGVTRQTINNIESEKSKLSKTQYIAIRSILDAEIAQYPEETEMLRAILEIFVDNPDKYSTDTREKLLAKANMIAPSILSGSATRTEVSKEWISAAIIAGVTLSAALLANPLLAPISSVWLTKLLAEKEEKHGG